MISHKGRRRPANGAELQSGPFLARRLIISRDPHHTRQSSRPFPLFAVENPAVESRTLPRLKLRPRQPQFTQDDESPELGIFHRCGTSCSACSSSDLHQHPTCYRSVSPSCELPTLSALQLEAPQNQVPLGKSLAIHCTRRPSQSSVAPCRCPVMPSMYGLSQRHCTILMVAQYPASFACNSESIGVTDTVNHVVSQAAACPTQVFALVGYSQGADLMHNATIQLSAHPSITPRGPFNPIPSEIRSVELQQDLWLTHLQLLHSPCLATLATADQTSLRPSVALRSRFLPATRIS